LQLRQETFRLLFFSGSEIQRRHFCGACKGTENRITCCDRLRCSLRNDDNRPSLTSGAAKERQDVSSINTIDELSDAITGGNMSVSGHLIYRKNAGILVGKRKVIFKTRYSTTQKREKLVTEMHHKSYATPEPQRRSR